MDFKREEAKLKNVKQKILAVLGGLNLREATFVINDIHATLDCYATVNTPKTSEDGSNLPPDEFEFDELTSFCRTRQNSKFPAQYQIKLDTAPPRAELNRTLSKKTLATSASVYDNFFRS